MIEKSARATALAHAAKGNSSLRRVLDDMYERIDAAEAAAAKPAEPAKTSRRSRKKAE